MASRLFDVKKNGQWEIVNAPFGDMFNHSNDNNATWGYDDERDGQYFYATKDIKRGEPIHLSYGEKCNTKLLLSYGFVVDDNINNEIPIIVRLNAEDPYYEFKLKVNGKDYMEFNVKRNLKDKQVNDFIKFVRLCGSDDLVNLAFDTNQQTKYSGVDIEFKMWNTITTLCNQLLSSFQTTYEQDMELLNDTNLSYNIRNCIKIRSGQKKILLFFIECADKMKQLLGLSLKEARKEVNKNEAKYKDMEPYINDILFPGMSQV